MAEDQLEPIRHAAELHDVGKVGIPDAILSKPGPLDAEEWAFMRRHTIIGERIVVRRARARARRAAWCARATSAGTARATRTSSQGEAIPIGSRIIAVCDAFDAMRSDRPYKAARRASSDALAELRRCAGTQFDPAVVEAYCAVTADELAAVGA